MVSENNSPDKASIQPMLKDLSVVVDKIARGTINEKGIFSCALGACVAKASNSRFWHIKTRHHLTDFLLLRPYEVYVRI